MAALKVLAFAAATGRVGSVFLDGESLQHWHVSIKAAGNSVEAAGYAQEMINRFKPDVVVTEECDSARHKGRNTLDLIGAIARTAAHNDLLEVSVPRERRFPNKYAEAEALVERYPELAPWQPQRRRFYDNEPRHTVLFEALALARQLSNS